jgi:hypothetical protein
LSLPGRRCSEFESLLNSAAERGAERVLAHLGLENGHAARDIRELRNLDGGEQQEKNFIQLCV